MAAGPGSEVEGQVDALSSFDADQLRLLLRLGHAGSDGIRPRRHLDEEVLTWSRHTSLRKRREVRSDPAEHCAGPSEGTVSTQEFNGSSLRIEKLWDSCLTAALLD